ncbi:MAG: hypothetical protein Ct9H300mP6_08140 [Gammaproteobacteria bacterium]|nr:MAG: hypothetical protein Ct9H300mP6_08140 [Gammaproteobacteria bacterium]
MRMLTNVRRSRWQNWLQEYMKAVNGESYSYDSESASFGVSYMLVGTFLLIIMNRLIRTGVMVFG